MEIHKAVEEFDRLINHPDSKHRGIRVTEDAGFFSLKGSVILQQLNLQDDEVDEFTKTIAMSYLEVFESLCRHENSTVVAMLESFKSIGGTAFMIGILYQQMREQEQAQERK